MARAVTPGWDSWKRRALDLFFPPRCVGCGREGRLLCGECMAGVTHLEPPWCRACGLRLPYNGLCSSCREEPLSLEGVRSAFAYQRPLRDALLEFKYHRVRALGEELAHLLADHLVAHPLDVDVLAPVPLHPGKRRERGYNQAEVLSQALGRLTGTPVAAGALVRVRSTPPQARLRSRKERQDNVAGAFAAGPAPVKGLRVLLVDDVCTTGATLSACGDALRAAGAREVWGLTVAREE